MLPHVQHHDDEQEQHHDGAGVDDRFEYRHEGCAQRKENHGHRQQRQNKVDQGMHNIALHDHPYSGDNCYGAGDIKENHHVNKLLTSTGAASLSASPLSLPLIVLPATL